jgi:YgiT-type zinc finger domain-containing protein
MQHDTTTDFTDLGTCMVIIKKVPCLKCDQCGETIYTGRIVQEVERIIDGVKDSLTEVAIINYSENVA